MESTATTVKASGLVTPNENPSSVSSGQSTSVEKTNDQKIIEFLTDKGATSEEAAIKTRVISQAVFGKGASRKMINPTIYAMQKKGQVKKIANENGGNPRWYLA